METDAPTNILEELYRQNRTLAEALDEMRTALAASNNITNDAIQEIHQTMADVSTQQQEAFNNLRTNLDAHQQAALHQLQTDLDAQQVAALAPIQAAITSTRAELGQLLINNMNASPSNSNHHNTPSNTFNPPSNPPNPNAQTANNTNNPLSTLNTAGSGGPPPPPPGSSSTPLNQPQRLPEFKVTSKSPPTFDGKVRSKQAHEAQAIIDQYLKKAADMARLYDFRADSEPARYHNHKTYVDWISTGLTSTAQNEWHQVSEAERHRMTFAEYKDWIQNNFSSKLTLTNAVDALDKLTQKGSCKQYTLTFNDLVQAIRAAGGDYTVRILCVKYLHGLKDHLRQSSDLFKIQDNLADLQDESERLDDFHWRMKKGSRTQSNGHHPSNQIDRRVADSGPTPMELDNVQTTYRKLTEQEKLLYKSNGWCTYCRSKDHPYEKCNAPGIRRRSNSNSNSSTHQSRRGDKSGSASSTSLNNVSTIAGSKISTSTQV
jgi:hypothetical protein